MIFRNIFFVLFWGVIVCVITASRSEVPSEESLRLGAAFLQLHSDIREMKITPDSARYRFQEIFVGFRGLTTQHRTTSCVDSLDFVFPVKGYGVRQIGGNGAGYFPKGFNLFDHRVRGSHPAHDIFVFDKNKDHLDDRDAAPIDILSMRSGIVVATETQWAFGSLYRGGNFVWIYDPCLDGLFYYAHNSKVFVNIGDYVKAGQKIGEAGRTGYNAYQSRSSTHLHLMYLQLTPEGLPIPRNTFEWLKKAQQR
jgi:peptidoglycan LD-endopeptidase LytH